MYIRGVVGSVGRVLAVRSPPKFRNFTAGASKPHRKISATMGRSGEDKRKTLPDGTGREEEKYRGPRRVIFQSTFTETLYPGRGRKRGQSAVSPVLKFRFATFA